MSIVSKIGAFLIICVVLPGCINHSKFAALDSPQRPPATRVAAASSSTVKSVANPQFYLVKPGDTLYSIAFRFGLEYRKLAAANRISSPYRIYEGQSLALKETSIAPSEIKKPVSSPADEKGESSPQAVTKVNSQSNDVQITDKRSTAGPVLSWKWPHNGKIVRTFSGGKSASKGIDLRGRIGDSVLAATNGVVVYAGNGLPGYGNLIILEHSNALLSAYAFAEEILVTERQTVKAGQRIATMGKQGDQPSLHFEIRQNGKPVNPLGFLPKR